MQGCYLETRYEMQKIQQKTAGCMYVTKRHSQQGGDKKMLTLREMIFKKKPEIASNPLIIEKTTALQSRPGAEGNT